MVHPAGAMAFGIAVVTLQSNGLLKEWACLPAFGINGAGKIWETPRWFEVVNRIFVDEAGFHHFPAVNAQPDG